MSLNSPFPPGSPLRGDDVVSPGMRALLTMMVIVVAVAALFFGRDIFVPLALAVLLSFALAPPVRWLRRIRVPNVPAVLFVVGVAFFAILAFGYVLAWQVTDLATQLPRYQANIEQKIDSLRESPPGGRLFERANDMFRDLGRKIEEEAEEAEDAEASADPQEPAEEREPLPVEVHEPDPTPMELLRNIVGPLINPLATAGIVIVFVIFLLLKREDLRDRMIRLVGGRDLPRTTQAMNDAAWRVGHYLLMQLVVNLTYGIPVAVGLWLIGVPNPLLWGMLCTVLRFVPYIGPVIGAFFPLVIAVAVDPSWSTFLWTGALFVVIELISNNAIEPWLYGSSTGLSPVAIIVAAIFWTWLWGPIGLLLSTPLTVCLVVLGRHVPQLAFLDILFGNEPVLTPPQQLYQRLLVGDPHEATERAEEFLAEHSLTEFYDEIGIAALALAEQDRERGALSDEQMLRVAESAMLLVDNLSEWEQEPAEGSAEPPEAVAAGMSAEATTGTVVCAGARGPLDDAAAAMLAQIIEQGGSAVRLLPHRSLQSARLRELEIEDVSAVSVSYMNADSLAHARFMVRRLRRRFPGAKVVVGFWAQPPEARNARDPGEATSADAAPVSLAEAAVELLNPTVDEAAKVVVSRPALAVAAGGGKREARLP